MLTLVLDLTEGVDDGGQAQQQRLSQRVAGNLLLQHALLTDTNTHQMTNHSLPQEVCRWCQLLLEIGLEERFSQPTALLLRNLLPVRMHEKSGFKQDVISYDVL